MANYKHDRTITANGVKIKIDTHWLIRDLQDDTAGATAADTMYRNGAVYLVPSGKLFRLVLVKVMWGATAAGNLKIYGGVTEDAVTTLKATIESCRVVNCVTEHFMDVGYAPIDGTVNQYIVILSSGANIVLNVQIVGYEY